LVEILPGKTGLLHISEIANDFVKDVKDWLKVGDKITVKIIDVGDEGKFSLSKRAADDPNYIPSSRNNHRNSGGFRGDKDRHGRSSGNVGSERYRRR